jgi:hypothetical protein
MKHVDILREFSDYPCFQSFQNFMRFYEELKFCSNEFTKHIEIIQILLKSKNLNETTIRNFEIIKLNFNFLLGILNLFKFDLNKKIERTIAWIYIIKLYGFVLEEFDRLRRRWPSFFYFSKDEENRYLEALRILFENENNENSHYSTFNLYPSKIGFLYLRYLRYYISKINKYIFKTNTDLEQDKLSFYVNYINFRMQNLIFCVTCRLTS